MLVKDGKPCSGGGSANGTHGAHHDHVTGASHADHEAAAAAAAAAAGMPSLIDVGGLGGHPGHPAGGHHFHHGLKHEYSISSDVDVCGDMHAAAAVVGLGPASTSGPLPTLMHMGYGAPHHRHMLSNHQDQNMCSYLQHRSAW